MKLARPYGGSAAPARSERNGSSKSPTSTSTLLHQPLDVREGFDCRHDPVGHLAHGVVHPERTERHLGDGVGSRPDPGQKLG
jgi:hypothetical protein